MRLTMPITAAIFCLICIFCGVPGTEAQEEVAKVPPATTPSMCEPCPGAACCSDCKVKVECDCHYDERTPHFQFNVSVDDRSNGLWTGVWHAQFGPDGSLPTATCLSNVGTWTKSTDLPYTKTVLISNNDCGATTQVINPGPIGSPFTKTKIRFSNEVRLWEDHGTFILDEYFVKLQCDCIVEGDLIANYTLLRKTRIEKNESSTPLALTAYCGNLSCCLDVNPKKGCCEKNISECCLREKITIKPIWVGGLPPFIKSHSLVIHALNCWVGDVVTGGKVTMKGGKEGDYLVKNGCLENKFGLTATTAGEFSFQAFRFDGSLPPHRVYIQCQMVVCQAGSCPILSCLTPGRRKRSVDVGSYLAMQEVMVGPISITDAPNTSYAAKVVRPRRKFAGARRRLDQMMRKLGQ